MREHWASVIVVWSLFLVLAGFAYGYRKAREHTEAGRENLDGPPPIPLDPPRLSGDAKERIEDALRRRKKIEAIKILREETGVGLKQAKEHVETMERHRGGFG
ncbi:MAG: ribosomal protein L7/L12 [Novosphingobium sp.]|nr:ribosomal protein L7/L12 [Novosphingobium sp.]